MHCLSCCFLHCLSCCFLLLSSVAFVAFCIACPVAFLLLSVGFLHCLSCCFLLHCLSCCFPVAFLSCCFAVAFLLLLLLFLLLFLLLSVVAFLPVLLLSSCCFLGPPPPLAVGSLADAAVAVRGRRGPAPQAAPGSHLAGLNRNRGVRTRGPRARLATPGNALRRAGAAYAGWPGPREANSAVPARKFGRKLTVPSLPDYTKFLVYGGASVTAVTGCGPPREGGGTARADPGARGWPSVRLLAARCREV